MPAVSKAQRKLFALALAVKRGEVDAADVDDKIRDLSKKKEQDLKDYAETPEETLPNKLEDTVEENNAMATPGSVNGMGSVSSPGSPGSQAGFATQETGSGDIASTSALTDEEEEEEEEDNEKESNKVENFLVFNAFVNEMRINEAQEAISDGGLPRGFFEVVSDFELTPGGGWGIKFKKGQFLRSNSWGLQRLTGPNKFEEVAPPIKGTDNLDITKYGRKFNQQKMIDEFVKATREIQKFGSIVKTGGK